MDRAALSGKPGDTGTPAGPAASEPALQRVTRAGVAARERPFRWVGALTLSVALAAIAYLGVLLWTGWEGVADALRRLGAHALAVLLLLSLVNYVLRFVRWQHYVGDAARAVPVSEHFLIYLSGFALTTTPGKAGETLRTVYLLPYGVGVARSVGAFVGERLSDLLAMLVFAAVGAGWWFERYGPAHVAALVLAVLAVLALWHYRDAIVGRVARSSLARVPDKLRESALAVVEVVRCANRGVPALAAHGLGCVAWAAEALALWLLLGWLGQEVSLALCFSIYALAMLAGAVSMLPGGLGSADAAMAALLVLAGCDAPVAVAATLVIRLTTLWFAVLLGALAILRLNVRRMA